MHKQARSIRIIALALANPDAVTQPMEIFLAWDTVSEGWYALSMNEMAALNYDQPLSAKEEQQYTG